jgi:hypothetical protein
MLIGRLPLEVLIAQAKPEPTLGVSRRGKLLRDMFVQRFGAKDFASELEL